MTAFGEEFARGLARMNEAALVLLFGKPEERRAVELLLGGKLPPERAAAVRGALDGMARNRASGRH